MSFVECLGELMLVGLESHVVTDADAQMLAKLRPSGIILFRHNIHPDSDWPKRLRQLLMDAKRHSARNDLIISIDHEGGRVNRLAHPATKFPAAQYWKENSEAVGAAIGSELNALGINLNFAPVVDVALEPRNTVIGNRAFSSSANEVAQWATIFVRGLHSAGVAACAKHFPGHGATIGDSHFELPELPRSLAELRDTEFVPYRAVIAAGVQMIMTAHILCREIDPEWPATLSPNCLQKLLREELNFDGVIVSDALEMKALAKFDAEQLALQCLKAGVDCLMCAEITKTSAGTRALRLVECIRTALEDGRLAPTTVQQAVGRMARFRSFVSSLGSSATTEATLGAEPHAQLCQRLEQCRA